jgi:hypothetical protein
MRTWVLYSRNLSAESLRREVEALGGYWLEKMDRGVVQRRPAAIFLDPYLNFRDELEADELRKLESDLGGSPELAVAIGMSSRGDSKALAEDFGRVMVGKYGGVLLREE